MKSTRITQHLSVAIFGASLIALPLTASAELSVGDTLGKTEAEIRASLESVGYVVEEIEIEDGEIEAEIVLNGFEFEIDIDPITGKVVELEQEHSDQEDDESDSSF